MSRMNMNALAIPVATAVMAIGNAAAGAPDASAAQDPLAGEASVGLLNDFGPAYSSNVGTANQELDQRLEDEGSNGCAAQSIAAVAGITTAAGRAKYITPGNVFFKDERNVTNQQYPINTGATNSCTAVEIPNQHSSSLAADVEFKTLPKSSQDRAKRLSNGAWELIDGVIRIQCGGNALLNGNRAQVSHKHISGTHTNLNVSVGVIQAAVEFAPSISTSESSSSSTITCPDGTTVTVGDNASAEANAEASAIAGVLANIQGQTFDISGNNMSFTQFQQEFAQDVATVEGELTSAAATAAANVNATTNTSSNLSAECGSSTSTPLPPPPPIGQIPTEVFEENNVEPFTDGNSDSECVDVTSDDNDPVDTVFSVSNVTGGGTVNYNTQATQPSPATTSTGAQRECTSITVGTPESSESGSFILTAVSTDASVGTPSSGLQSVPESITLYYQPSNF